jgi:hypothetical protein
MTAANAKAQRKRVTIDLDTSLTDEELRAAVMVAVFEVVGDEKDDGS